MNKNRSFNNELWMQEKRKKYNNAMAFHGMTLIPRTAGIFGRLVTHSAWSLSNSFGLVA